jgi:predicted TIM-barrel fold metal-dependent hydrolase
VDLFFEENRIYADMIKAWLAYTGAWDKMMYGTDFPIVNMGKYIEFVKRIVPEKHHEKVFYENAKRIYKLNI